MNTYETSAEKRTAYDPRPDYFILGVDTENRHHVADTTTNTVHIIHSDGSRGRKVLDGGDIGDYVDAVADAYGWETRRYGQSLADHFVDAVEVQG